MSDMEFQTLSRESLPNSAPMPLAIEPRMNGFRKNTRHMEAPLFGHSQSEEDSSELTSSRMRNIRFGSAEDSNFATMDFSVSAKRFKRSGEPSFGIRPMNGERMKLAEPADPFEEPLV
ncbi:MAG: hypothetical protein ACK49N_03480 [Verrucomicrobiota bacterium]